MLTATFWVALGVIVAALIAREVKISEFRQAWINELRVDISEYMSKAHEWIDLYLVFNNEVTEEGKVKIQPQLDRLKYDAIHIHGRICLRFKPDDKEADRLLALLLDLLDPSKLVTNQKDKYTCWRQLSDIVIQEVRVLLKEEWEQTKNPLKKYFNFFCKVNKK